MIVLQVRTSFVLDKDFDLHGGAHFTRAKRYVEPVVITDLPSQVLINAL
jgi:hypothetical protein